MDPDVPQCRTLRVLPEGRDLRGKPRLFNAWMPDGVGAVLDVGCAFSHMLALLGRKAAARFGVEYDLSKLLEARQRFHDIHFINGSGEALPLADATMDVVTFFEVLEHVENERRFLQEVHRVLKSGGRIMLSVPNKGQVEWMDMDNLVFTPLLAHARKCGLFGGVSDYYLRHHRHYSLDDLRRLFDSLFAIEQVYYGGWAANQVGFLVYKSVYLALTLCGVDGSRSRLLRAMEDWMNHITSWDFEHSYGARSDKVCILARKIA